MILDVIREYYAEMRRASNHRDNVRITQLVNELGAYYRSNPPSVSEVVALLKEYLARRDLPEIYEVLRAAWSNLSQDYVPYLCEIVMSEDLDGAHEQAIGLLGALPDPRSITSLRKAVCDRREDDQAFRCVPTKALLALHAIGTPEAIAVIEEATRSDDEIVRVEAKGLIPTTTPGTD